MNPLKHLFLPRSALRRAFPSHAMTAIEEAVAESEAQHRAEIRVVIEPRLELPMLLRVRTPRQRALEVFEERGCDRTAERNGVLIYILLAERRAEIVADRGLDGRVTEAEWRRVRNVIEDAFARHHWLHGVLQGIEEATKLLAREFPAAGEEREELPNRPSQL